MSDAPTYNNPDEVPGKFSIIDPGETDAKGRRKIKIRFRERIKTRTRTRTKKDKTKQKQAVKIAQILLLLLAVFALFYVGHQMLMNDLRRPIIIRQKGAK